MLFQFYKLIRHLTFASASVMETMPYEMFSNTYFASKVVEKFYLV